MIKVYIKNALMLITLTIAFYAPNVLAADGNTTNTDISKLQASAGQGNSTAQYNLGYAYFHGEGVTQDYIEASKWYRKAADQGLALAQFMLGAQYFRGIGIPKDEAEGVRWLLKSANQNNPDAQSALAIAYYHGMGAPKDNVQAYMWAKLAADQNVKDAKTWIPILEKEMIPNQIAKAKDLLKDWKPQKVTAQ